MGDGYRMPSSRTRRADNLWTDILEVSGRVYETKIRDRCNRGYRGRGRSSEESQERASDKYKFFYSYIFIR